MQRRNREITIFSLSAIDLFCSGMGAVMVVMVLLLPFYKKDAKSQLSTPADLAKSPPPTSSPVPDPEPHPTSSGATIRVENTDLVFVIDATASMEDEIQSVRTGLYSLVQVLRRLSDDVRIGFVAYIDREVPWSSTLLSVNRDPQGDRNLRRLQDVVRGVELVGNQDWPEDVYGGLQRAVSFSWTAETQDRRQMIVVIGDAPTHPEDTNASLELVRRWSSASANRSVSTVFTGSPQDADNYDGAAATIPYLRELAAAGGGESLENQGDLMGSILDLVIIR